MSTAFWFAEARGGRGQGTYSSRDGGSCGGGGGRHRRSGWRRGGHRRRQAPVQAVRKDVHGTEQPAAPPADPHGVQAVPVPALPVRVEPQRELGQAHGVQARQDPVRGGGGGAAARPAGFPRRERKKLRVSCVILFLNVKEHPLWFNCEEKE